MYGNVRRPDKTDSLLQRHVVRGDIMGPDIADALLTLQVILRHLLHRRRHILKRHHFCIKIRLALMPRIKRDKDQDAEHQYDIDRNETILFHEMHIITELP